MSHAQKNKTVDPQYVAKEIAWRPTAKINTLRKRAEILKLIRDFFAARSVLEVETPLLCHTSVTDPFIESIPAAVKINHSHNKRDYYLQTSPEYAMKRLLSAGSGAIFQISKAFRQGEVGQYHNPEFTMLEWYRPGFNHHQLMDEMDELLQLLLATAKAERYSYAEIFATQLHIDPHTASPAELQNVAAINHIQVNNQIEDRDTWLNLLLTHCIEPHLGKSAPCFIYDFPQTQAALARIQQMHADGPFVASRFEVYFRGIELANGFHELQDVDEQRKRFAMNLQTRTQLGLNILPIDEYFLAALRHGLPDCAGVALGVDRLIMLATESKAIADVLSFSFENV